MKIAVVPKWEVAIAVAHLFGRGSNNGSSPTLGLHLG